MNGMILIKAAQEILDHLAEDGSGPVLLIGAEEQRDGAYELTFKRADVVPRSAVQPLIDAAADGDMGDVLNALAEFRKADG